MLKLNKQFKSYEHLKIEKNVKNQNKVYGCFTAKTTTYGKQHKSGVTSKFILKKWLVKS